jgi:MinD-like ATPase involved in chromosome partitioning or flagellar assembly
MFDLLIQNGLLSTDQLERGLALAHEQQCRLGEALIRLGYLSESDIDHALSLQEHATIGLLDAMNGEPLDHCVAGTTVQGLEILPIGGARLADASRVSPKGMARVIQEAREAFDVVLIDTGPVPGSIDSSIACSQADQVVMVISKGNRRPDAERSMQYLDSIQAKLSGVVFNRASVQDMNQSNYSASLSRSDEEPMPTDIVPVANGMTVSDRFGPVAQAVAKSSRSI